MTSARGWRVREFHETAAELHALAVPRERAVREIWIMRATDSAVVLGSAQPDDGLDCRAAARLGLDVTRRRSGGGAVLVEPGNPAWVDVILPAGDPLWEADVGRSFAWLGEAWRRALASLGMLAERHDGPLVRTPASGHVCFAGVGPGELLIGGRKVVGLSQRRTREVARFQCAALVEWHPRPLVDVFRPEGVAGFADELESCAAGTGTSADDLIDAFLDALP